MITLGLKGWKQSMAYIQYFNKHIWWCICFTASENKMQMSSEKFKIENHRSILSKSVKDIRLLSEAPFT